MGVPRGGLDAFSKATEGTEHAVCMCNAAGHCLLLHWIAPDAGAATMRAVEKIFNDWD